MRFCSMVGQAISQTARAIGPSTMERSRGLAERVAMVMESGRLFPPLGVEAPRPEVEIRHGHLAGQQKRDWASEEAEEEQGPAERLEDPGDPKLGQQRGGAT